MDVITREGGRFESNQGLCKKDYKKERVEQLRRKANSRGKY